jgi:hypothetical protein
MDRRTFLTAVVFTATTVPTFTALSEDNLYILPQDDIGRLKADFNANRSKVRLVFMLSPT